MKKIVLFRYHKKPYVCSDRLRQLKNFNPGIKIFGLYGGEESEFPKYKKYLSPYLEHNYCIRNKPNSWKWKNSDLGIRLWYKNVGKNLEFDMLHVIEWDLLLFSSLNDLYKKIPNNCIGLTALNPLKNIKPTWTWVFKEPYKTQWEKLLKYAKDRFGYNKQSYASLGPGLCLPKNFLDKFSSIHVPDLSNDEVRLPLFGQIFGFRLFETGFYPKWSDPNIMKFFNCHGDEIPLNRIKKELKRKGGRKSFHPYRKRLKGVVF
ncbi:TPA: hypothetical protein DF272_03180 [Candidatus Falkowbacteria bacterium]|nr:hypothetical protein [Candidatus Falkowbacteria bacterium]